MQGLHREEPAGQRTEEKEGWEPWAAAGGRDEVVLLPREEKESGGKQPVQVPGSRAPRVHEQLRGPGLRSGSRRRLVAFGLRGAGCTTRGSRISD